MSSPILGKLSKIVGSTTWTYTWDNSNRLLKVANGTTQGLYAYDGVGRLVEGREGSQTNFFAYLGTSTLLKNGTDYVYAGTRLVAFTSDNLSYHTPRYYHTDALGSVRLMTKDDATVWYTNGYQPFGQDNGKALCPTCPTSPPVKFTGKPFSQGPGLYYYYQRWYDPSAGRFTSLDPLPGFTSNPQTLNGFSYVENGPTTRLDPSGMGECIGSNDAYCGGAPGSTDFGFTTGGIDPASEPSPPIAAPDDATKLTDATPKISVTMSACRQIAHFQP